jgi:hypothetical protein
MQRLIDAQRIYERDMVLGSKQASGRGE